MCVGSDITTTYPEIYLIRKENHNADCDVTKELTWPSEWWERNVNSLSDSEEYTSLPLNPTMTSHDITIPYITTHLIVQSPLRHSSNDHLTHQSTYHITWAATVSTHHTILLLLKKLFGRKKYLLIRSLQWFRQYQLTSTKIFDHLMTEEYVSVNYWSNGHHHTCSSSLVLTPHYLLDYQMTNSIWTICCMVCLLVMQA